ncbi:hypothetical protein [Burkholderia ubonensis]|uniref:hypothetical protein n=1 Tax=Burkholderia ubonensis TaxID=101571 RepID=UPI000A519CE7|nr:hypothetical protein [Burkholderia ubonensis]
MGTPSVMPVAVRGPAPRSFRGSRSRAVLLWMGEELLVGVATKNARTITERIAGANKGMD